MIGYCDSDFANSTDHAHSILGYSVFIGGGCFSWASKKQTATAFSSGEAEYYATCGIGREIVWLRQLSSEIGFGFSEPTSTFSDSNVAMAIIQNPYRVTNRTKHINIQYHWIREAVRKKVIAFSRVDTEENVADIFTKGLPRPRHEMLSRMLGVHPGNDAH